MSLGDRVGRPFAFAAGFLARNARSLLVDALVIAAWAGLLAAGFALTGWPLWGYTPTLVGGIVGYTLLRDPLEMPEA